MGRLLDEDIVIDALIGISGSKSIEELTEECEVYQSDNRCYSGGVYGAILAIKALPPIQPEKAQLSKEGTTFDLISRQAAIDALDCINGTEEVLRSLPPAQPECAEGEWVQIQRCARDAQPDLECPFCKHRIGWWDMGRYCAGCGAKLKGGAG